MIVPASHTDLNETDIVLNEPTGQKQRLTKIVLTIFFEGLCRLFIDIERSKRVASEQLDRFPIELVIRIHLLIFVSRLKALIKRLGKRHPPFESGILEVSRAFGVLQAETSRRDRNRREVRRQEARPRMSSRIADKNVFRQIAPSSTSNLRDPR